MANAGQIPSQLTLAAGESLRVAAGGTTFEAFTPAASTPTIPQGKLYAAAQSLYLYSN